VQPKPTLEKARWQAGFFIDEYSSVYANSSSILQT
jgi:hypothetical protein